MLGTGRRALVTQLRKCGRLINWIQPWLLIPIIAPGTHSTALLNDTCPGGLSPGSKYIHPEFIGSFLKREQNPGIYFLSFPLFWSVFLVPRPIQNRILFYSPSAEYNWFIPLDLVSLTLLRPPWPSLVPRQTDTIKERPLETFPRSPKNQ